MGAASGPWAGSGKRYGQSILSEAPAGEWIEDAAISLSLSLDSLETLDPGRDVCDRSAVLAQHRISLLSEKGMHRSQQKGRGNGRRQMSNLSQRV